VSLNALAALLISPVSWSHHWVWGETTVLVLAVAGWARRDRVALAAAVVGLVVFASSPQFLLPLGQDHELHWAAWEQVVGSPYVLFALVVLVLSAVRRGGFPRQPPEAGAPPAPLTDEPADPAERGDLQRGAVGP
jgi:alpha-1,2-mannosyltransferase